MPRVQPTAAARGRARREYERAYKLAHRDAQRAYGRAHTARLRARVLAHYGDRCACCGTTERLVLDHVNGDGRQHRLELFGDPNRAGRGFYRYLVRAGFPPEPLLQVLCRPCSSSKSNGPRCRLDHGAERLAA